MFGTLIVQLPSDYSGGDLVVEHAGKENVFSFNGIEGCTNFHYAAFYADCQHELKKVTKGYRLCLVYNLLYTGSGLPPVPAENGMIVSQLVATMKQWSDEAIQHKGPAMMAYILEHMYSLAGLSFKALKNADRAISEVLVSACQEANFDLYLAHVSCSESWSATCYYNDYSVEDLCDDSIAASDFVSPPGQPPAYFTGLNLDDGCLVPEDRFKEGDPDEEECSEATGNEGATVERWYKYTALVFWPIQRRLVNVGCTMLTNKLKAEVLECESPLNQKQKKESVKLARELVASDQHTPQSAKLLLKCLHALGQTELIKQLLSGKISDYVRDKSFREQAFSLCGSLTIWDSMKQGLLSFLISSKEFTVCCEIINELFTISNKHPSNTEPKVLCKKLASTYVASLNTTTDKRYESSNTDLGISMLRILQSIGDARLVSHFLVVLASISRSYYPNKNDITQFLKSQSFISELFVIGGNLGWETLKPGLQAIFKKALPANIAVYTEFLYKLCSEKEVNSQQKPVCAEALTIIVNLLTAEQDFDPSSSNQSHRFRSSWDFMYGDQRQSPNEARSKDFVTCILKLLVILNCPVQTTTSLVTAFLRQPNRYPLENVLFSALEDLRTWSGNDKSRLITPIVSCFISGIGNPCSVSCINWSQNLSISCCQPRCEDCKTLQQFLNDPVQNQTRFRINQVRRSHIVKQLAKMKANTTHFTQNTGSPHTLIVNKVKPSKKHQEVNLTQILSRLRALCPELIGAESAAGEPQPKRQKTADV